MNGMQTRWLTEHTGDGTEWLSVYFFDSGLMV